LCFGSASLFRVHLFFSGVLVADWRSKLLLETSRKHPRKQKLKIKAESRRRAGLKQPVRLAGGWCWFVLREKYSWLVVGGWFVVREKYCWLVADKPSEQGERPEPWSTFPMLKSKKKTAKNVVCTIY
jgi:hypothetical protein